MKVYIVFHNGGLWLEEGRVEDNFYFITFDVSYITGDPPRPQKAFQSVYFF